MTDATVVAVVCGLAVALATLACIYAARANARTRRIQRTISDAMARNAGRRAHDEHLTPPANGARR